MAEYIVRFSLQDESKCQLPSLKFIGNLVAGSPQETSYILDFGAIDAVHLGIESENKNVKKESLWIVSNLCAGSEEHIELLIRKEILTKLICSVFYLELVLQRSVITALGNCMRHGSLLQIQYMIDQNLLVALQYFLHKEDTKIICQTLKALN